MKKRLAFILAAGVMVATVSPAEARRAAVLATIELPMVIAAPTALARPWFWRRADLWSDRFIAVAATGTAIATGRIVRDWHGRWRYR